MSNVFASFFHGTKHARELLPIIRFRSLRMRRNSLLAPVPIASCEHNDRIVLARQDDDILTGITLLDFLDNSFNCSLSFCLRLLRHTLDRGSLQATPIRGNVVENTMA